MTEASGFTHHVIPYWHAFRSAGRTGKVNSCPAFHFFPATTPSPRGSSTKPSDPLDANHPAAHFRIKPTWTIQLLRSSLEHGAEAIARRSSATSSSSASFPSVGFSLSAAAASSSAASFSMQVTHRLKTYARFPQAQRPSCSHTSRPGSRARLARGGSARPLIKPS